MKFKMDFQITKHSNVRDSQTTNILKHVPDVNKNKC
jgi:hypothetical protein